MSPQNSPSGRRFIVSGRVQGVGYRAFAVRSAQETGVSGWTRNLDDGTVEVQAVGTSHQLDNFEARIRQGPRWSDVRGVQAEEIPPFTGSGFYIR